MAEKDVLNPALPYPNHGNTVASWALVIICAAGVVIGAIGFDIANTVICVAGIVIALLGVVVGIVLRGMGYGQGGSKTKYPKH